MIRKDLPYTQSCSTCKYCWGRGCTKKDSGKCFSDKSPFYKKNIKLTKPACRAYTLDETKF